MLIEENTSMDNSSSGLMNNAGSYNNSFNGNNVFNCGTAMGMYEWSRPNMIYGIKIFNNTFSASKSDQRLLDEVNYLSGKTQFGTYNNNHYIDTASTNPFYKETKQKPKNSKLNLTLQDWQAISKQDLNSTAIFADNELLKTYAPDIIINESITEKEYVFAKDQYRDNKGEVFTGPVKLGAYQSIIVLKKTK
jgi:hypothetical protein